MDPSPSLESIVQVLGVLPSRKTPVARTPRGASVPVPDGLVPSCVPPPGAAACAIGRTDIQPEGLRQGSQDLVVKRFDAVDRRLLAAQPGIGNRVIARMEEVGFHSLAQLRAAGSAQLVDAVCCRLGSIAWRNRLRSLERALARTGERAR